MGCCVPITQSRSPRLGDLGPGSIRCCPAWENRMGRRWESERLKVSFVMPKTQDGLPCWYAVSSEAFLPIVECVEPMVADLCGARSTA